MTTRARENIQALAAYWLLSLAAADLILKVVERFTGR